MTAEGNDKKYKVLFDTSKKEMLNPNQGFKVIVKKLKTRYTCTVNKTNNELTKEVI